MDEEIDIKELLIALWNKKIFIIVITLIFVLIGAIKYGFFGLNLNNSQEVSPTQEKNESFLNENENIYVVGTTFVLGTGTVIDDNLISTYQKIISRRENLTDIIEEFNLNTIFEDLENMVLIARSKESNVLEIFVKYPDEEMAKKIANKLRDMLSESLKELYNINKIIVIDEAKLINEEELISMGLVLNNAEKTPEEKVLIIAILGLVLSCGIVVVIEIFNSSVKNEKALENATGLKVLASILPFNNKKEKFRLLRVNVNDCKTILVTSPEEKDGKTYIAMNLARSFCSSGKNTLFIDLNSNLLKECDKLGLIDFLESDDKSVNKYVSETNIKNLDILTLGKTNEHITELLESDKMSKTLRMLETVYDIIIIDSRKCIRLCKYSCNI